MLNDILRDAIDEYGIVAVVTAIKDIAWTKGLQAETIIEGQLYARVAVALEGAAND